MLLAASAQFHRSMEAVWEARVTGLRQVLRTVRMGMAQATQPPSAVSVSGGQYGFQAHGGHGTDGMVGETQLDDGGCRCARDAQCRTRTSRTRSPVQTSPNDCRINSALSDARYLAMQLHVYRKRAHEAEAEARRLRADIVSRTGEAHRRLTDMQLEMYRRGDQFAAVAAGAPPSFLPAGLLKRPNRKQTHAEVANDIEHSGRHSALSMRESNEFSLAPTTLFGVPATSLMCACGSGDWGTVLCMETAAAPSGDGATEEPARSRRGSASSDVPDQHGSGATGKRSPGLDTDSEFDSGDGIAVYDLGYGHSSPGVFAACRGFHLTLRMPSQPLCRHWGPNAPESIRH